MKKHFYAVWVNYLPNSAPTNRMLSYLEAWSKQDVDVTVVFTLPDRHFSKVPFQYSNIQYKYLWDVVSCKWRLFHYLIYGIYVRKFRNSLKSGDNVYVYGQANLLPLLRKRDDIMVYHETTEHPAVIPLGVKLHKISLKDYMDCCLKLNGIFVISSQLKSFFVEKGIDKERIEIVNMTVESTRFEGVVKRTGKFYIAYCGNASNNKDGVDRLIKAFAMISSKYQDLFLYIIGQAPNQNEKDSNVQLAIDLGIADKVVFTGTVNYNELPQILTDAAILALCRPDSLQAKYGFPTKLGEYLLSGNPIVITDTGDISKFLVNQDSAMIVDPNNIEDFALKIGWLIDHPEEAKRIGEKGQKVALKHFNARTEAKKIVDFMFK
jgi:glycosyltransferase involved in cell wall biosynthesis